MIEFFYASIMPKTTSQLGEFYLFWMLLYGSINFIWDWRSKYTEPFHIANIGEKLFVLYNASTFASSVLLISSVFYDDVRKVAGDAAAPIVIAALSGLLVGIAGICPYKPGKIGNVNDLGAGGYVVTSRPSTDTPSTGAMPDTPEPQRQA